ncbi:MULTISPECIES: hypothetical protein [Streptomyces]|nr:MULTISPECIES: hypothetical protein [Streptomyces]MDI5913242.1 hypothetical protein [Streptomyces sp. 12257]
MSREGKGPARRHLGALTHLAIGAFLAGCWDQAWELSDEGITVSNEHGFKFFRWYFDWVHALVAAGRGEAQAARQLTDDVVRWAVAHQATGVTFFALQARAFTRSGQATTRALTRPRHGSARPDSSRRTGQPR